MDLVCEYIGIPSGPCCLKAGKYGVLIEEIGNKSKRCYFGANQGLGIEWDWEPEIGDWDSVWGLNWKKRALFSSKKGTKDIFLGHMYREGHWEGNKKFYFQ